MSGKPKAMPPTSDVLTTPWVKACNRPCTADRDELQNMKCMGGKVRGDRIDRQPKKVRSIKRLTLEDEANFTQTLLSHP
jgi:hypothetical protein